MRKRTFALIGSGWRAEFYIRIAQLVPQRFTLSAVLVRDPEKGRAFAQKFGVSVVNDLDALLLTQPDFVVLSIKRGHVDSMLQTLFERGVPVLCETPPAETKQALVSLWQEAERTHAKVQIAEQYFVQPLYAAWYKAIEDGLLGRVQNMDISALHGYHGASIIRRFLGEGMNGCTLYGKRYAFDVTETYGREGMCFDGQTFSCTRDRLTFEFEDGKVAFFDFSDPAQYHSFIRTRQLNVQGDRGEIDDLSIRYLTKDNVPVSAELRRIDLGVYNNQEWTHFGLMLGERFLYRSELVGARLNDDELAVAACLEGMGRFLESGEDFYSLADALQDMYLCLCMDEALATPLTPVHTQRMPWCM